MALSSHSIALDQDAGPVPHKPEVMSAPVRTTRNFAASDVTNALLQYIHGHIADDNPVASLVRPPQGGVRRQGTPPDSELKKTMDAMLARADQNIANDGGSGKPDGPPSRLAPDEEGSLVERLKTCN